MGFLYRLFIACIRLHDLSDEDYTEEYKDYSPSFMG